MGRRVVLVCGPPASGKSTWVRERASEGDLIVDYDEICRTLGSGSAFDHPASIRVRADVARRAFEKRVSQMTSGTAWVIRSAADPKQRDSLARALNATETVVLATPAAEARRRAVEDHRPVWTGPAIDRWWQSYQPSSSRQEREFSMSQPLEGYRSMPETEQQNDESTEQEQTAEVEETEETTDSTDEGDVTSDGDESPEDKPKPKPPAFDVKRAEAKIRKANSEAANLRKRLKELEPLAAKAKEIEDANKSETERLQGQLADAEKRIAGLRSRAVKSEVRALASANFADPTDPEAHLALADYVDENGEIDTAQVEADLADLLERKPHLGKPKAEPERKRPAPDRTQASSANKNQTQDPAEAFAGFIKSRLKGR